MLSTGRFTLWNYRLAKVHVKRQARNINNLLDSVTNFTVNENKKIDVCEKQALKLRSKGNNGDDIERELLQVDQPHYWFQNITDQPHNSAETPIILFGAWSYNTKQE